MTLTNKAQRQALRSIFLRGPIRPCLRQLNLALAQSIPGVHPGKPLTYRQFRSMVMPTFGCDGAITVPWCSMWLAIEQDGYVHS